MDTYYWIGLKSVPQVGNVTFRRLLDRFGTPQKALSASHKELSSVRGIGPSVVQSIKDGGWRKVADLETSAIEKSGARVVTYLSEEYPSLLKELDDAPPYLYLKGHIGRLNTALAIVGSRKASSYGIMITERLARDLAASGITIVSGMARGIDTAAHRGALRGGGMTLGVLGCGIDVIYPPENAKLFSEMAEKGGIVSEFPLATLPLAENFPRRNRIISGICRGVLVVEAAEKSGSLITAEYALEQGRDVFAIPGNITFSGSRGTNGLIKQGAKLVETVEDILEELSPSLAAPKMVSSQNTPLAAEERTIVGFLNEGPLHIDDLIIKSALTVGDVSAILLRLELKGAIVQLPGKIFAVA